MNKNSINFLFDYLNNKSPVGHELSGQKIWLSYIEDFIDTYFIDTYGNTIGIVNPDLEYKVVLEAHADEISWRISYINNEGYMYVIRNGGSDYSIAPSMRAKIHIDNDFIPAIFGWPAIHVRDPKKNIIPNISNIILDCGCNSKNEILNLGVHVGSIVTFDNDLMYLNKYFLVGRALDNKIGGFIIAEVLRKIYENNIKLPFGFYITNSVQEEVGLRGASMVASSINPNLAIVIDVTHDTQSPLYNKIEQGDIKCGKGLVLNYAPSIQNNVLKMMIDVANNNKISFQRLACSSYTGTDTDAFAYSNKGISSVLISLPLKYMHTTVEMSHKNDIVDIIYFIYKFLIQFNPNYNFNYF